MHDRKLFQKTSKEKCQMEVMEARKVETVRILELPSLLGTNSREEEKGLVRLYQ